jgi:hypothetical protein
LVAHRVIGFPALRDSYFVAFIARMRDQVRTMKKASFDVSGDEAPAWLAEPTKAG